jgi:hypothetical protein
MKSALGVKGGAEGAAGRPFSTIRLSLSPQPKHAAKKRRLLRASLVGQTFLSAANRPGYGEQIANIVIVIVVAFVPELQFMPDTVHALAALG